MEFHKLDRLPARVHISRLLSSRYDDLYARGLPAGERPCLWEERRAGVDLVIDAEGQRLKLQSSGQQSPPQPGWAIVIRGGGGEQGYEWTLHGLG